MTVSTWPFSAAPELAASLELMSDAAPLGDARFPARNFRLEWQIPAGRVDSYEGLVNKLVGLDARAALTQLNRLHNKYLEAFLRHGARTDKFDPASANCPEPFKIAMRLDEFGHSDDNLLLVRSEDLGFITRYAGISKAELRQLAAGVAAGNRDDNVDKSKSTTLTYILQRWQESCDNRPTFAAFWDDAQSILANPTPGWAEELRDRLGLLHYEPAWKTDNEVDVIVFRYPVRLVPRYDRSSPRLLLRPTVLDGALSEAFCTAPPGTGVGSTIDLAGRNDQPWQEVIHPPVEYKAEHVWAIDTIKTSPPADLARSRALHIIKLYMSAAPDFQDLCHAVDGDLM